MSALASIVVSIDGAVENRVLLAASTGQGVKVLGLVLESPTGATINLHGGTATLSGRLTLSANSPLVLPVSDEGWFATEATQSLLIDTTGPIHGVIRYRQM